MFLDTETVAKVNFLGRDYKKKLLELVDRSQLLQKYGGDLVDFTEHADWEGEIVLHPVLENRIDFADSGVGGIGSGIGELDYIPVSPGNNQ
jgi:hypothetical protein